MKNRTIVLLTYAVLLLIALNDTIAAYTVDRYEGSRREAFIQRYEGWWRAIRRAYRYKAARRRPRLLKSMSRETRKARVYTKKSTTSERYTGKRRNPDNSAYRGARRMPRQPWNLFKDTSTPVPCVDTRTPDGLICVPLVAPTVELPAVVQTVPADPWQEYMLRQQRNNTLTLTGQEGPHQHVSHTSSILGRRQDPAGENARTAQQMHPGQGRRDHHGTGGQTHRGGGLQRPAIGLAARLDAVYDVVSAGRIPGRESAHRAVPRVRRLPQPAR